MDGFLRTTRSPGKDRIEWPTSFSVYTKKEPSTVVGACGPGTWEVRQEGGLDWDFKASLGDTETPPPASGKNYVPTTES